MLYSSPNLLKPKPHSFCQFMNVGDRVVYYLYYDKMMIIMYKISVQLLLYSQSESGKKIATFVVTMPKFIQAQINSHRMLSRNAASSRAMPSKIIRRRVLKNPFLPIEFSKNQSGMRGGEKFKGIKLFFVKKIWLWSRYIPCFFHYLGEKLKIHKEVLNRIIEPWMFTQVLITATEWGNFLKLRIDNSSQPEIQYIAKEIKKLLDNNNPNILKHSEWHLPFINEEEKMKFSLDELKKISTARCARVSYKLYDGKDSNLLKDVELCEKLISGGHWSPFEHIATPEEHGERISNFIGWKQYRKEFSYEDGTNYTG